MRVCVAKIMPNKNRIYTTPDKKQNNQKKKKRTRRRGKKKYKPLRLYTRMPAARVMQNRSFMTQTRSGNSVRVTGYDLIYNTNEGVVEGPFCVVTCNPAYWDGTRIANIASSYAQYRPLSMRFDYYPQVSTMTNGNVVTGTIWNNNSGGNNLQQTLATSNAGKIFPVYASCKTPVRLKTNLNQNLYNFQGYLDSTTNPFVFIATTQQSNNIIPGYFMVSYTFEFKNPLGDGYDYDTQVTTAGEVEKDDVWDTTTAVLLSATNVAAIGTKLLVKIVDDAVQFFLGGSRLGVIANTVLKLFKSRPKQQTKLNEDIINLNQSNKITYLSAQFDFEENGSSVTNYFTIQEQLKLANFKSFKTHLSGQDYAKVGGIFVRLEQVGTGRYNLGFYNVSNYTGNVPQGLYILQTTNPVVDYSLMTTLQQNSQCYSGSMQLQLQFENYSSITCSIPSMDDFDTEPHVIADIALDTIENVMGINRNDIVGNGDVIMVPINNETRLA